MFGLPGVGEGAGAGGGGAGVVTLFTDACWVLRYINRGAYLRQTPDREWRLCEAHEATQFASQTVAEDALVDVQHWACRSGERGAKTLRLALSGGVVLVEMWAVAYQRESR